MIKCFVFTDFLEKRAEFPLFFERPRQPSCQYFSKFNTTQSSNVKLRQLYQ
ncbi:hypothetical protein Hanom_Chr11g01025901 [Helianthus anomalus]